MSSESSPEFLSLKNHTDAHSFYYADERNMDGSPAYGKIDGPAHGEFYLQLAKGDNDIPWLATFVKGHGYKQFEEVLRK